MGNIKAIETHYKGYRFRSRLEARWAVFFDALGIQYQYEHQGFVIGTEPYLPDYWLPFRVGTPYPEGTPPTAGYWLEIKPGPLANREVKLLEGLCLESGHNAYAFAGDPWPGEFMVWEFYRRGATGGNNYVVSKWSLPDECSYCRGTGFIDLGPPKYVTWRGEEFMYILPGKCGCGGTGRMDPLVSISDRLYGFWCNLLDDAPLPEDLSPAFAAARSARFEHGETPR